MDIKTIILLVEVLVIVGLSTFVWFGTQDEEAISTLHWVALLVVVVCLIGFAVTMFFTPMA